MKHGIFFNDACAGKHPSSVLLYVNFEVLLFGGPCVTMFLLEYCYTKIYDRCNYHLLYFE